ncbi:hypothetical protein [Haladaptatus sp. AB643]|uniref:hypothetical protein n=1 Tax=Haladaptatus sp. AB643 TaxID=2934174 RepID=UPI00209BEA33|nr:hypothetical protein [Haladaptatus sp. AB643]MCO8244867.1 hypothetical protein [Haladaptatus sp. AB643]
MERRGLEHIELRMSQSPPSVNRRQFLQATIASTTVLGTISTATASQSHGPSQYSLEQDGKCIPIEPLSKELPVEKFYDFRTPFTHPSSFRYASFGTTNLQRKNTSILFLYQGPKGLSLVAVHDKKGVGSGGAVTFRITNLPADGEIAVKDDKYPLQTNYDQWDLSKYRNSDGKKVATLEASWAHGKKRTDGMAYRGLGDDFEFTINPEFNQKAVLSNDTHGEIKRWEVLSGDINNPTRTKLNMNKPVTISSKSCQPKTTTRQTTRTTKTTKTTQTKTSSNTATTTVKQATKSTNDKQSVLGQIWNDFSSVLHSIESFFTSLF